MLFAVLVLKRLVMNGKIEMDFKVVFRERGCRVLNCVWGIRAVKLLRV